MPSIWRCRFAYLTMSKCSALADSVSCDRRIAFAAQVQLPSEDAARQVVLENLAGRSGMEDFARSLWQMAGTLRVERRPTEWTERGKYPSLVVRRG